MKLKVARMLTLIEALRQSVHAPQQSGKPVPERKLGNLSDTVTEFSDAARRTIMVLATLRAMPAA